MPAKKKGASACVCLNASGNSGGWIPMIAARDIKATWAPGAMFDASDRADDFYKSIPTRLKPQIEFDMIANAGAAFVALRTAFVNGTPIHAAFLQGAPGTSAKGMRGDWAVCGFPLEHPLMDGQKVKIVLKPHGNYTYNFDPVYTDALGAGTPETAVAKRLGTVASVNDASHNPINAAQDIKWTLENGAEFDSNDRTQFTAGDSNLYWVDTVIPTRKKFGLEFGVIWDESDAQLTAIRTAFLAGVAGGAGPLEMWALDGAYVTSGAWGVHADFAVEEFPIDAPLLDGQKVNLKFAIHGNGTHTPGFVTR